MPFFNSCLLIPIIFFQLCFIGYEYILYNKKIDDLPKLNFSILLKEKNPQKTLEFDPIRGFRLQKKTSRMLRITKGKIEFVGNERGNNKYFQDRDNLQMPNYSLV